MNNCTFEVIPLVVEARGEVISSNVGEFRELVREALGNINRNPETDEEFGQAEMDVKALKSAEERISTAKEKALSDAETLYALLKELDETSEEIRISRLELERQINSRKEEIKAAIIEEALGKFDLPIEVARNFKAEVTAAIKGKRTIDSIRKTAEIFVLTRNALITKSREKIQSYIRAHGDATVPDAEDLELKAPDAVEIELKRRFQAAKAAEEKARIEEELRKEKAKNDELRGPKIGSIPTTGCQPAPAPQPAPPAKAPELTLSNEVSEEEELSAFKRTALESFAPLKAAKGLLQHPANIERANAFAAAVNAAWKQLKGEGATA